MKITRILLDVDDVLADFTGGVARLHHLPADEKLRYRPDWAMYGRLGELLGLDRPQTDDEFWQPIHAAGAAFWHDLAPLPWLHDLLGLAKLHAADYRLCTSPSRCPTSYHGKALWVQEHLGGHALHRLCPTAFKHDFAQPGVVLIDDREESVDAFIYAGGHAILFPVGCNRLRAEARNPLAYVRQALAAIVG